MGALLLILLIHWLADFVLQTEAQAINKSSNNIFLAGHVFTYSIIWFLFISCIYGISEAIMFFIITFVCHFITDYVTSRISKSYFDKKDYHNGFVVIGFDQILHYIQLFYTFEFITSSNFQ